MEAPVKHYKFINSRTDNVIYYYSLAGELTPDAAKEKLESIKAQVATTNGVFLDTIYYQEIKDE